MLRLKHEEHKIKQDEAEESWNKYIYASQYKHSAHRTLKPNLEQSVKEWVKLKKRIRQMQ